MSRDDRLRLDDILEAATKILTYTEGYAFEQFTHDPKTVDAVVANFIVIGGATKKIPHSVREQHPEIPWREMAGMRDIAVHEYFGIRLDILWRAIQDDLPRLTEKIRNMLTESE